LGIALASRSAGGARRIRSGTSNQAEPLPRLLRRLDPEQTQPGRENGYHALDKCKARHRYLWIMRDNEA
jgi:hypothetical protein